MVIQRTTVETFDGHGNLMHSEVTTVEGILEPGEKADCGCGGSCHCGEPETTTCPGCGCELVPEESDCDGCGEDDVCEASDLIEDAITSLQQAAEILSGRLCE